MQESSAESGMIEYKNHDPKTRYSERFFWKKGAGLIEYESYYGDGLLKLSFKTDQ
jgi:hypothetical protein